ncbi:MAG: FecR domain-containing protein [Niabella sp.]
MRELYQLLQESPAAQSAFDDMNSLAKLTVDFSSDFSREQVDGNWDKVQQLIRDIEAPQQPAMLFNEKRSIIAILKVVSVAACILLAVGAGVYFWGELPKDNKSSNVMITKKGSRSYIELSDGTKVWLNADTKLTYGKNFDETTRDVFLTGEAYFDVRKDANRPFIVHTENLDIQVLGTVFNVSAYENDRTTTTTLLKGSIKAILKKNEGKEIILKPSEKLVVRNETGAVETRKIETTLKKIQIPNIVLTEAEYQPDSSAVDVQWTKDILAFRNTRLDEIAVLLERWYGTTVVVKDPSLQERRFSGVFETETLQQVIEALAMSGKFNYSLQNNELTIYP